MEVLGREGGDAVGGAAAAGDGEQGGGVVGAWKLGAVVVGAGPVAADRVGARGQMSFAVLARREEHRPGQLSSSPVLAVKSVPSAVVSPERSAAEGPPPERRVSSVISLGAKTRKGGPQKPAPRLV